MFKDGRIPLWLVATVAGTGVLVVVGLFFFMETSFIFGAITTFNPF